MNELSTLSYKLRKDIIEMVHNSKAGHVGGDLSVIDILTTLYFKEMNVSPDNWDNPDRDRFLLSKGHCADALYCVLGEKGFYDKEEAIKTFSQYNSKFIGHPNTDVKGVEINSGSLGHGISIGVGMALALRSRKSPARVYVVTGDGEMAEGSNYEGMMAAGHYKLDNLCVTVDLNRLQISGPTADVMDSSDLGAKFKDFGFNVVHVADGNDCAQLAAAYELARGYKNGPTAVIAHTVKGKGVSFMEDQSSWHHGVMNDEQYKKALNDIEEVLG